MATEPAGGHAVDRPPPCGVARVRGRAEFDALRHRGRRGRAGSVAVTFVAPPAPPEGPGPVRVAFAVDRRAGGAVVRNRVRRRLRAGLRQLAAEGSLPPGAYLVRAQGPAATQPWPELLSDLDVALRRATAAPARTADHHRDPVS